MGTKRNNLPLDKDTLYDLYICKEYTIQDIADAFSCSLFKAAYWLRKYNIPRRKANESLSLSVKHGRKAPLKGRPKPKPEGFREKMREVALRRAKNAKGYSLKHNGYCEITQGENKGRRVHDVIMEQHIGRPLTQSECVHHINHDRSDNRIENLRLMTKSGHSKLHIQERIESGENINHLRSYSGEEHPHAKLSIEQAKDIKYSKTHYRVLMEKYGISKSAISHIRAGHNWKNI